MTLAVEAIVAMEATIRTSRPLTRQYGPVAPRIAARRGGQITSSYAVDGLFHAARGVGDPHLPQANTSY